MAEMSSPRAALLPRLHLVTDDGVLRGPGFVETAGSILARYGDAVALHLRGHGLSGAELYRLGSELAPVAADSGALLLMNDRIDIALAVGAAGAQVGRRSIPVDVARRLLGEDRILGYSAHEPEELRNAAAGGGDYIVYGTIFPSATHPGEATAGVEGVRKAAAIATLPIIAIGGMRPERVSAVRAAGAHGVAVLGGVWYAEDPLDAVGAFLGVLEEEGS